MNKKNNNAPAFPTGHSQSGTGITKREYVAALAMQGILSNPNNTETFKVNDWWIDELRVSELAYAIADKMLE
jgi:hypothetical protein